MFQRTVERHSELNHGKMSISSSQTSYETKNLQHNEVEYQFWVTGSTKVGEGPSSRVVTHMASSRGMTHH